MGSTKRYAELVALAAEKGHSLRLLVVAGTPEPGDALTYGELGDHEWDDLDSLLDKAEAYLGTEVAERRGRLARRREDLEAKLDRLSVEAGLALAQLDNIERHIGADVEDEIDGELDEGPVSRQLRERLGLDRAEPVATS